MNKDCIVVHYSEIGLKGKNRAQFENQLRKNIVRILSDTKIGPVRREFGRIIISLKEDSDWVAIKNRLKNVFGISSFSKATLTGTNESEIISTAISLFSSSRIDSFRVNTKRADKNFKYTSIQLNQVVGAAIKSRFKHLTVDLKKPDIVCSIEIFNEKSLISISRENGLGGLPVSDEEKVVALISSGIDSPVAAWKVMRRGIENIFVHFHTLPLTSEKSVVKTNQLIDVLTGYQFKSKLYIIPFVEIQKIIAKNSPNEYRLLLFRAAMMRVAEIIARKERASALVTGDNIGQVASQTLSNICAIDRFTNIPVLRPLLGFDKEEIINLATQIGTYPVSIQPHDDCCSLFTPKHPELHAEFETIQLIENDLKLNQIYPTILNRMQVKNFNWKKSIQIEQ
ncbi:MAG: tRNA 4-thiouridine(8) synthase ThiI [Calditrichia bacterium]